MKRKYWPFVLLLLWVSTVVAVVVTIVGLLRLREFDWSSFVSPGVMVVMALVITLAWWMSKDDKTD